MSGALVGLRVLDISSLYAAPLAASMLADFGADVIKVEPPEGDGLRGTGMWPMVARGKRSLVLDLRSTTGQVALRRLAGKADVLVQNFPAEVLRKRGLDWDALSEINPRLIMLSISCFGQGGPYADRPGSGTIGEAFGGLTHLTGRAKDTPMLPSVALGDALGAMNAVIGTMTALYARDHGKGHGQQVDASLYEPILTAIGQAFQWWRPGNSPSRNGSRMPEGGGLRNLYATADDRFVAVSASTSRHIEALATLASAKQGEDLDRAVAAWIICRPLDESLTTLVEHRVPVAPVNDIDALLADPQARARRSIVTLSDPELGDVLLPAPTPHLSLTPGKIGAINPPLGGAGPSIFREWGVTQD